MGHRSDAASTVAARDEEAAFAELYRAYYRPIRDFCRRRVPSDLVDDATAETFLTAWRRRADMPGGDMTLVWLYGVAYRVVGHEWRGAARRRRLENRLRAVARRPVANADDALIDRDDRERVALAASRLTDTDADVLRLYAWEQLAIADIASVLGIAPNAVKQRLHRARHNLAREYDRLERHRLTAPTPRGAEA